MRAVVDTVDERLGTFASRAYRGDWMRAVVDTNVLVVANKKTAHASPECVIQCVTRLNTLQKSGKVVLDDKWRILKEYGMNVSSSGQPGVGDAFFKWVLTNSRNPDRCEQHTLTPKPDEPDNFFEIPNDPALQTFDRSDRKFAAVAVVSGAPVWNAVDSDWWNFRALLQQHRIAVEFLCPDHFAATRK